LQKLGARNAATSCALYGCYAQRRFAARNDEGIAAH
jgi:hypothetical protein